MPVAFIARHRRIGGILYNTRARVYIYIYSRIIIIFHRYISYIFKLTLLSVFRKNVYIIIRFCARVVSVRLPTTYGILAYSSIYTYVYYRYGNILL